MSPGRRAVPALVAAAAVAGLLAARCDRSRPKPRAPTGALQLPVPAGAADPSAAAEPRRFRRAGRDGELQGAGGGARRRRARADRGEQPGHGRRRNERREGAAASPGLTRRPR